MTESEFYRKHVKKDLDNIPNIWYRRIEDNSQRGILDIFGCIGPYFFVLELKRSKAAANSKRDGHKLQKWTIRQIKRTGSFASIVYPENWAEERVKLRSLCDRL